METISGISNWHLTIERTETAVTILQAVTCDKKATLPDELFGLPVTALAHHALSRDSAEGEKVCIICGQPAEEWSNRKLREITLPASITSVGNYAFMNCRELASVQLYDTVRDWGISAWMNCRSLQRIILHRTTSESSETLAHLVGELPGELDVSIFQADGSQTRLIFPEYLESYEENSPAHHFDYVIYGAGHPYHHVFRAKELRLTDFDALWEHFLSVEHDNDTALRLAWWRVRYPTGLDVSARKQYESYLRSHDSEALCFALHERDMAGLRQLLALGVSPQAIADALSLARENRVTEASAILLEQQHRCHRSAEKSFDL